MAVVMGPTHAMSGAAVGLAVAELLPEQWGGVSTVQETFLYAGLTAGAALLPDLDSPQATVSRSFGPLTQILSRVVENSAQGFVNLTRAKKDPRCKNGHRTVTHTAWFALLAGLAATVLIGAYGKPAVIGLLFVLLGLAVRGLLPEWSKKTDWLLVTAVAAALAYGAWFFIPPQAFGLVLGSAVAVGCLTHIVGDMATKQGVPVLGPLFYWRGKRWGKFKLPRLLSISAGGRADQLLLTAFTALVIVQVFVLASGDLTALVGELTTRS